MALTPAGSVAILPYRDSAFDHGDVHLASGRIFVAHPAGSCIEVIDAESQLHIKTIEGCPEASGVLCAQDQDAVFAASRGAGKMLVIDPPTLAVRREMACGPRPNGLAWDARRRLLLVADWCPHHGLRPCASAPQRLPPGELPGRPVSRDLGTCPR